MNRGASVRAPTVPGHASALLELGEHECAPRHVNAAFLRIESWNCLFRYFSASGAHACVRNPAACELTGPLRRSAADPSSGRAHESSARRSMYRQRSQLVLQQGLWPATDQVGLRLWPMCFPQSHTTFATAVPEFVRLSGHNFSKVCRLSSTKDGQLPAAPGHGLDCPCAC